MTLMEFRAVLYLLIILVSMAGILSAFRDDDDDLPWR